MERNTTRLEAFSDGVFAIAITLLVLNFRVPTYAESQAGAGLGQILANQWPVYLAYVTSFLTILVMWINHHRLFTHIDRCDNRLLIWNGLLLMGITIVPFPTALVAEFVRHPGAKVAATIYSGVYVFIAVAFNLLWRHAAHDRKLLAPNHDADTVADITNQYRGGPILYLLTFGIALLSPMLSLVLSMVLAVFFALPPAFHRSKL